jgi:predicted ATPase
MSPVAVDPTFIGREAELGVLRARLDEVRAGEPRVILVEGPAGIGKTSLLRRFLAGAPDVRVISGAGAAEEQFLPYGVAEQLARSARIPLTDDLAALGRRSDRSPEPVTVGAAFLDLLGTLQRHGPVVIAVDDVQWADRPTLLALLFVLRRLHADRVLALFAGREEARAHVPEGLVRLVGDERGAAVHLHGLDVSELQALGAALAGTAPATELAEHLHEHTGGSPLHVRSLLEEVPLERLRQVVGAPLPAPRSFSAQVLSRLAGCSLDAQQLVLAASVLGPQCPLSLARRLAAIGDSLGALEEAMSARLLEPVETDGDRAVAFPHALVRSAIYHDIGPARRAGLHRRAAELIADEAASIRHRVAASVEHDDASPPTSRATRAARHGAVPGRPRRRRSSRPAGSARRWRGVRDGS